MKIKNLVGRKFSTLSQSEKEFYWELDLGILNTCDHSKIVDYSNNLILAIDGQDLKGYDALCEEAYEDLGCEPIQRPAQRPAQSPAGKRSHTHKKGQ